mmetsp:Transcript_21199/g.66458  ORF Transcript_21199/g.66458 Transcript_21199/m.66458 type:complete len:149 (-) Transcript_21199:197-643(-)
MPGRCFAAVAWLLLLGTAAPSPPTDVPDAAFEGDDPCSSPDAGGQQCELSLRQLRGELRADGSGRQEQESGGPKFRQNSHQQCTSYSRKKFATLHAAQKRCGGRSKSWCTGVMGPMDGQFLMCRDPMTMFPAPAVGGLSRSSVWTLEK